MSDKTDLFLKVPAAQTASDQRNKLVREQIDKERAATDAKTARLRALRLAKEASEPPPPPKPTRAKRTR